MVGKIMLETHELPRLVCGLECSQIFIQTRQMHIFVRRVGLPQHLLKSPVHGPGIVTLQLSKLTAFSLSLTRIASNDLLIETLLLESSEHTLEFPETLLLKVLRTHPQTPSNPTTHSGVLIILVLVHLPCSSIRQPPGNLISLALLSSSSRAQPFSLAASSELFTKTSSFIIVLHNLPTPFASHLSVVLENTLFLSFHTDHNTTAYNTFTWLCFRAEQA
jgi:hypothetical protein